MKLQHQALFKEKQASSPSRISQTKESASDNTVGRERKHKTIHGHLCFKPQEQINVKFVTINSLCQILQADCGKAGDHEGNTLIQTYKTHYLYSFP